MLNLYSHSGSENHGCEAIVRSTVNLLEEPTRLFTNNKEQDVKYGIEQICEVVHDIDAPYERGSREWFFSSVQTKLTKKYDLLVRYRRKKLLSDVNTGDVFLSIGGDNYCYAGTEIMVAVNNNLKKRGAKLVLWGCSVEPALVNRPGLVNDLASYNLIVARESISYEALKKVNKNTVLAPDPAFTLEKVELSLPNGWIEGNMIGINASPLILQSAKNGELAFDAYRRLMEEILRTTDCGIALIPHVVWEDNDDREPLQKLYEEYKDSGRVMLIDDHNCMELKGYIARCRMFIGARTHATIAAYSSCVPTLVLGYSVKSRGIARDLFGTEENYVISVQDMNDPYALGKQFQWMLENELNIKNHLQKIMPDYVKKVDFAKDAVEKLYKY